MAKVYRYASQTWQEITPRYPYSGTRWAYEVAKEVSKYPEVIDPRLYAQAQAYAKLGGVYEHMGYSPQQASEALYKSGKKLSGWTREVIFESLHKFEPGPEEAKLLEPFQEATKFGGKEWAERWNKAALLNKYTKAVEKSQSIGSLAIQATRAGIGEEWARRVVTQRPALAEAIESAMKVAGGAKVARGFAPTLKSTMAAAWRHRLPLGIGMTVFGLYSLQAGQWFSASDDVYNTIEGLPHGGESERMRKLLTDFGSGWIGNLFRRFFKRGVREISTGWEISASALAQMSPQKFSQFTAKYAKVSKPSLVKPPLHPDWSKWTPSPEEVMRFNKENVILSQGMTSIPTGEEIIRKWGTAEQKKFYKAVDVLKDISKEQNIAKKVIDQGGTYSGPKPRNIEGLSSGVMGKKGNMDAGFGSPWRGLISIPKILQGPARRAGLVAFSGTPEQALHLIGGQMKKEIPSLMQRGPRAVAAIEKQKAALNQLMGDMKRSPFQDSVLINPLAMKQQARALGVDPGLYLKGTLRHERFHQMVTQDNLRGWIENAKMKVPWSFKRQLGKVYKQQGKTLDKATLREEYLAYSLTEKYTGRLDPKLFNEADKVHEQIAMELAQRNASKASRWHGYHKASMRRASMNSLRPGKRHRQQAGRIVQ